MKRKLSISQDVRERERERRDGSERSNVAMWSLQIDVV